jgi:hypothetical protein
MEGNVNIAHHFMVARKSWLCQIILFWDGSFNKIKKMDMWHKHQQSLHEITKRGAPKSSEMKMLISSKSSTHSSTKETLIFCKEME